MTIPLTRIIDISKWQGAVNWTKIQAAYLAFEIGGVIVRAGTGTATGMSADPQLDRNRVSARARGVPLGFYGFAYPGRSSGATQARGMATVIGPLLPGELVILDLENGDRPITRSDIGWATEFLDTLEAETGAVPLIYMNTAMIRFLGPGLAPIAARHPLWVANYGADNGTPGTPPASVAPWAGWSLWQYTQKAALAGIQPVDASLVAPGISFQDLGRPFPKPAPAPTNQPTEDPGEDDMPPSLNDLAKAKANAADIYANRGIDFPEKDQRAWGIDFEKKLDRGEDLAATFRFIRWALDGGA